MGSRLPAELLRVAILGGMSATAAVAWFNALYATALAALIVALVGGVTLALAAAHTETPPAPSPPPPDPAAREERQLLAYLDVSPAPLVTLESDRRLRAANRAARQLFGEEDLIPDAPEPLVDAIRAMAPGRTATVRVELGGRERVFALAAADLTAGAQHRRIAALIDIEAELKAVEAKALRELLQILSHEIMNTLTPIASLSRTASEMMTDVSPDLPAVRDAVATVARRAEGLQRFTGAYRDLARLPEPELRPVEIGALLADLARLFATRWASGARLVVAFPGPQVAIAADADQLNAALWALLQNAVEAAPRGDARVTMAVSVEPTEIRFRIADNGPGVAEADREEIFQPFVTRKTDGSGVGLALARQIVRGHQGELRLLTPVAGEGACFEAVIPRGG